MSFRDKAQVPSRYVGQHSPLKVNRSSNSERGFSLLTTTVCMTVMVAFMGLSIDLGRLYIAKNELQAFVDTAAFQAAFELDGTTQGINRARLAGEAGPQFGSAPNRWHLGTEILTGVNVLFSDTANSGYTPTPASGTGMRFLRVDASGSLSMMLLPVIPGISINQTVRATAFAGQSQLTGLGNSGDPFSPDAIDSTDTNFGFTPGQMHTLKWAPPGQRNKPGGMCAGEAAAGYDPGNGSGRGFIDVGQGNGNSALHDAIVNRDFDTTRLDLGDVIDTVPGNKHVGPAMQERFDQDTDTSSTTYSDYQASNTGNGRRLMYVPINNPANQTIIGFATFFLPPNACGSNNQPCCAEYVGASALLGSTRSPAAPQSNRVYAVKLLNGGF
jgi:hypothetical protein